MYRNPKLRWGNLSACVEQPETEVCDGLDTDCDGLMDNGACGVGESCECGPAVVPASVMYPVCVKVQARRQGLLQRPRWLYRSQRGDYPLQQ